MGKRVIEGKLRRSKLSSSKLRTKNTKRNNKLRKKNTRRNNKLRTKNTRRNNKLRTKNTKRNNKLRTKQRKNKVRTQREQSRDSIFLDDVLLDNTNYVGGWNPFTPFKWLWSHRPGRNRVERYEIVPADDSTTPVSDDHGTPESYTSSGSSLSSVANMVVNSKRIAGNVRRFLDEMILLEEENTDNNDDTLIKDEKNAVSTEMILLEEQTDNYDDTLKDEKNAVSTETDSNRIQNTDIDTITRRKFLQLYRNSGENPKRAIKKYIYDQLKETFRKDLHYNDKELASCHEIFKFMAQILYGLNVPYMFGHYFAIEGNFELKIKGLKQHTIEELKDVVSKMTIPPGEIPMDTYNMTKPQLINSIITRPADSQDFLDMWNNAVEKFVPYITNIFIDITKELYIPVPVAGESRPDRTSRRIHNTSLNNELSNILAQKGLQNYQLV